MKTKKPTPAQAIMLRELVPEKAASYVDFDRNGRIRSVYGWNLADKKRGHLNPASFRVLIRNGWVEKVENEHNYRLSAAGRAVLASLQPEDFIPEKPALTAEQITELLRDRYAPPEWVFFNELRCGTGYGRQAEGRIDGWVMNTWPSTGLLRIAFEIKISRGDFLKELSNPEKRSFALSVSNQFFFVAPAGMIKPEELPEECGLMEVTPELNLSIKKNAPRRETGAPSWLFVASLGRRMQHYIEAATRAVEK